MSTPVLDEILKLSVEDRIRLVEEIWETVSADPQAVPVTQAQREELDRRLDDLARNPETGRTWEEFRSEVERKG
jgi:putative addiction module component (TIGR02574 family)